MASLIDNKVKTASRRADMIQEILASLSKSNASFKSARKLSEFVAEKMQEKGEPIDSSTLRRKGSQYKELIDNFIGKGAYQSEHAANITKDLKLRKQNKRVTELEALLKKKIVNWLIKRQKSKCYLLIDIRKEAAVWQQLHHLRRQHIKRANSMKHIQYYRSS